MSRDGKKLRVYENHRAIEYKPNMFASESQFDEISESLRKKFVPKMIYAHEMRNYMAVILSDLRIIEVDDEDEEYVDGYEDESYSKPDDYYDDVGGYAPSLSDLEHTEITFHTSPSFTKRGFICGEITGVPYFARVCVVARRDKSVVIKNTKTGNLLSEEEFNFLTN